ncbi:MAG: hypothetical protein AVDCRST_MAG69-1289, partial [uncultured Solirubrobacteraceae bacterium]
EPDRRARAAASRPPGAARRADGHRRLRQRRVPVVRPGRRRWQQRLLRRRAGAARPVPGRHERAGSRRVLRHRGQLGDPERLRGPAALRARLDRDRRQPRRGLRGLRGPQDLHLHAARRRQVPLGRPDGRRGGQGEPRAPPRRRPGSRLHAQGRRADLDARRLHRGHPPQAGGQPLPALHGLELGPEDHRPRGDRGERRERLRPGVDADPHRRHRAVRAHGLRPRAPVHDDPQRRVLGREGELRDGPAEDRPGHRQPAAADLQRRPRRHHPLLPGVGARVDRGERRPPGAARGLLPEAAALREHAQGAVRRSRRPRGPALDDRHRAAGLRGLRGYGDGFHRPVSAGDPREPARTPLCPGSGQGEGRRRLRGHQGDRARLLGGRVRRAAPRRRAAAGPPRRGRIPADAARGAAAAGLRLRRGPRKRSGPAAADQHAGRRASRHVGADRLRVQRRPELPGLLRQAGGRQARAGAHRSRSACPGALSRGRAAGDRLELDLLPRRPARRDGGSRGPDGDPAHAGLPVDPRPRVTGEEV